MRRLFLLLMIALPAVSLQAQRARFAEKTHDFGEIEEWGGNVSYSFEVKNSGRRDLIIQFVKTSCGCTSTTWTVAPIPSGEKGTVTVVYTPDFRPGKFIRSVNVYTNSSGKPVELTVSGFVIAGGDPPSGEDTNKPFEDDRSPL